MVVAGVVLAARSGSGGNGLGFGPRIALIEVNGLIGSDAEFLDELRQFRRDESVLGYVVAINSPGGVVGPSQSIYHELRKLRESGMPVVAVIGGVGASGGYYVALGADSILAMPGSITGSIGVIMEYPNATELMDKVGVRMESVKSSEHKDIGSPFRDMQPSDRAVLDSLVQDVYTQFVDVVAQERNLEVAAVRQLADGRILSGRQALASGLIDGIGNVPDAIAMTWRMAGQEGEARVLRPPEDRPTIWDVILSRANVASLAELKGGALDGPRLKFVVPW